MRSRAYVVSYTAGYPVNLTPTQVEGEVERVLQYSIHPLSEPVTMGENSVPVMV